VNQAFTRTAEFRSRLYWSIGVSELSAPDDPGSLSYEPYFGLREKPFSLSPNPRFFFSRALHGAAFDTLAAGIRRREGILVLTGEVGTGKTTLCRAVLQALDCKTFAAYVPDPFLSREDLLKTLLVDFGVVSVDEIRSGRLAGASRTDLSYPLYEFLASLQPLKAFAVVVIDDAQNLTTHLLEEIRILSDLENRQKLLEVLLVGQPELQSVLATPAMRQLSQRVSTRCDLRPLGREDVTSYVSHRLTIAGNDGRLQFTEAAIDLVSLASGGIPRMINLICDRALLRAASSRTTRVDPEHILWAVDDLRLPAAQTPRSPDQLGAHWEPSSTELSEASAEGHRLQSPQREGREPAADPIANVPGALIQPEAHLEFFREEIQEALVERERGQHFSPAKGEGAAANSVDSEPRATAGTVDNSGSSRGSALDQTRRRDFLRIATPERAAEEGFNAPRHRRKGLLILVCVALAMATGWVGWHPASRVLRRPSDGIVQPTSPRAPLQTPSGGPPSSESANRSSQIDTMVSAPTIAISVASQAHESKSVEAETVVRRQTAARFVLQMATFQRSARAAQALQELRDAGYAAYSTEVTLRDGESAVAVFLGPYVELAAAQRDLDRARQIPGYGSGRVVHLSP
jgi:type II secretory pathway predicted ATPase ExeA/cell division septation protein DedD